MPGRKSYIPTAAQLARARAEGWYDWIQSSQDEAAVAQGCYFDASAAVATKQFFEKRLKHSKAPFAGKPFLLLDWQWHGIIGPIYGWKMPDATRRYLSAFVFIPKKNGKTQLAAGISIRELYEQRGARVLMSATAESQASDCFDEAAFMVENDPGLCNMIKVVRSTNSMTIPSRNSTLVTIPTSAESSEGKNASCIIKDELHAWKNRAFYNSLLYADSARVNSLDFAITTAGNSTISICYEEYERAKRIIDEKDMSIDHLAIVFEADKDAKVDDLEQWKKANPSYGITLPVRKIERAIANAKGTPEREATAKRYRLNLWTSATEGWLNVHTWDSMNTLKPSDVLGMRCFGGLDLARVIDIAAFCRLFELDGQLGFLFRLWMPEDCVEQKEKDDNIPLRSWIDQGFVTPTPGDVIDYSEIRKQIVTDHATTPIDSLGFDPYNAEHLCNSQLHGEDGIEVAEVPPTMAHMSAPATEFERLFKAKKFLHDHNPAVSWMVENVVVYRDSNDNIRPVKGRSNGRIDGVTAAVIAMNRRMAGEMYRADYYEENDVEFI